MSDPMARSSESVPPLFRSQFNSTSRAAGEAAARGYGSTVERILDFLSANGPACIWEVAQALDVTDNRISGRFSQLERDRYISKTGERRRNPRTGCEAEVYRLHRHPTTAPERAELLGYPLMLILEGEAYDRCDDDNDKLPGVPYVRRANTGGVRLLVRVMQIECEGCGRALKMVQETVNGRSKKVYRCGSIDCFREWEAALAKPAGEPDRLVMVMKKL